MSRLCLTAALICLVFKVLAVDIDMYPDDDMCDGDDFITCSDIEANRCCYSDEEVFESCEANMPRKPISAFSLKNDDFCGLKIGGSDLCWGVSDEIARITGCKWRDTSSKRDINEENTLECADGGRKPNFMGRRIGTKSYMLEIGGREHQEYLNLTSSKDQNDFLMSKADRIRDDEVI